MKRSAGRFLAVLACLLFPALPAPAEVLDHVAASVNREVITLSELRQAADFNAAMQGGGANRNHLEAETLGGLINRRLLLQEARRLAFADVSPRDIRTEMEALKKRFPSESDFIRFLLTLGMTEDQLGVMLGERLIVERFLEKKVGLFVRVGRDEVRAYYDANIGKFAGRTFQEASRSIADLLSLRKTDQQIAQYLLNLRSRADVRINTLPRE